MFKKLFKNDILNNQIGSTLSITIVVIAVLAFSVTAVTQMTVNLSGTTTTIMENVDDESTAKGLITQAISEFEVYITDTDDYTAFNNTEIPRILSDYNVIVSDETNNFPDFGDANGKLTKVYKFSYILNNGTTLYKYAYMSNAGSSFETFHPFDFSLGTSGDLILNGGYYDEIKLFGQRIYVSDEAPWTEDELTDIGDTDYVTPQASGSFPQFTDNGDSSEVFVTESYEYCTNNCFTVTEDSSAPYVINKSNYQDAITGSLNDKGDIQEDNIISFFNGFDFEDFVVDYATNILPTNNRTITDPMTLANFETVIRNNMDTRSGNSYPNTPYVDVTNDSRYTPWNRNENVNYGFVYDGDLTISRRHRVTDFDDEGLIVLGDLTIDNTQDNRVHQIRGTYIVTGDLLVSGYSVDFNRATFIVFGETRINFDYDYEMRTQSGNYEFSVVSQGSIVIDGQAEYTQTSQPSYVTGLFYTQESFFFDGVESKMRLEGAVFARALGNVPSTLNMEDELGNEIHGIVINSYQGYQYAQYDWNWDWDLWEWIYTKEITYVPSNNDSAHRFQLYPVPADDFQDMFMNIPAFEGVTVSDGEYTLETSEWKKE